MKFEYFKLPVRKSKAFPSLKYILAPLVEAKIYYRQQTARPFLVYLDTGSDFCFFDSRIGELLGVAVKTGKQLETKGIGGGFFKSYFHQVKLEIAEVKYSTEVGFVDNLSQISAGILGQIGFFDHFKTCFDLKNDVIEVVPK